MSIFLYPIIIVLILAPLYIMANAKRIKKVKEREEWLAGQEYTMLRIDVPRNNEKAPLAAEQMFASLHGIFSEREAFQPELSFEIVARDKYIQFYVRIPVHLRDFVAGQVYAQYPNVEIREVPNYAADIESRNINFATCELALTKPDVYPIKLFGDFVVDPISGITSVMSNLSTSEEVWLQMIIRPIGDDWQEKGHSIISAVRSGKKGGGAGMFAKTTAGLIKWGGMILAQAINPGAEMAEDKKKEVSLPGTVEDALKAIEYKIMKLGFESKLRVLSIAGDPITAKIKCQNVAAAFKQFNSTNQNGFKIGEIHTNDAAKWDEFLNRSMESGGYIMNISELASLYHFPHMTVATPNIVWSGAKKAEPPATLPTRENTPDEELTIIGQTNFRNTFREFGIKRDDRRRHVYIVGKSGTGKSTLIENMAVDDVLENRGVIIVDPHGELAEKVMACIPDNRIEDVVVFDPSDREYPIAFNLLEQVDDDFKGMVASGFVGIFKKIFGDSWGPRLEHILRNTVLALLDVPETTMLDIPRMLTDNRFRDKIVAQVKDLVIKEFWVNEFAQYDAKFRTEAVSPILNKVGQFLSTATIRNLVGQPHSSINIRDIMDQQKILIVNLSRGKIGEDNSALLGAMMITKIQLAAMSRANVTVDKRPDSYLYVDEFQNFATESFATILSEARKYNLCLTMAHQYVEQMSEEVRSAVFGNAGTLITFRVGGTDANFLVKEYEPVFEANDLVNLDKYTIYIKLLINGISSPAFSAGTFPPIQKLSGNAEKVINLSRKKYTNTRAYVEDKLNSRDREEQEALKAEAEAFKKGGLEALLVKAPRPIAGDKEFQTHEAPKREVAPEPTQPAGDSVQSKSAVAPEPSAASKEEGDASSDLEKNMEPAGESHSSQTASAPELTPGTDNSQAESEGNHDETPKPKKNRSKTLRYQNIVGNTVYKEQTSKGGVKWYVGEEIDEVQLREAGVSIGETAKKMLELVRKASGMPAPKSTLSKTEDKPEKDSDKVRPEDNPNYNKATETVEVGPKEKKDTAADSNLEIDRGLLPALKDESPKDNPVEQHGQSGNQSLEIDRGLLPALQSETPTQMAEFVEEAPFVMPKEDVVTQTPKAHSEAKNLDEGQQIQL